MRGKRDTHPVQLVLAICSFRATAHSSLPGSRIGNFKYNIKFCNAIPPARSIILVRTVAVPFVPYAVPNVLRRFSAKHVKDARREFLLVIYLFQILFSRFFKLFLNIEERNLHDFSLAFTYIFIYV